MGLQEELTEGNTPGLTSYTHMADREDRISNNGYPKRWRERMLRAQSTFKQPGV